MAIRTLAHAELTIEAVASARYGLLMGKRSLVAWWVGAVVTLVAVPALAEGAPGDEAFAKGMGLQQAKLYSSALDAFRSAYRIKPTPQSLLHIAECEVGLGRLVKAEEHLRLLADAAIVDDSPPDFFAAQAQARIELAELAPRVRVGFITVRVSPPNAAGLHVTVDDWSLDATRLSVPVRVDPGSHVVVVTARDRMPVSTTVTVAEGDQVEAPVTVGALTAAALGPTEKTVASPELVAVGGFLIAIGGAAFAGGVITMVAVGIGCFMRCSGSEGAVGGVIALAGVGTALIAGLPLLIVGNQKVSARPAVPRVSIAPRAVQLGWTF